MNQKLRRCSFTIHNSSCASPPPHNICRSCDTLNNRPIVSIRTGGRTSHTNGASGTMRAKKAIKRLSKAQELLSSVIGGYGDGRAVAAVRDLLRPAIDSIVRAKGSIEGNRASTPSSNQHSRKTIKKRVRRLSTEGRRRLSLAARKRWAAAKRKGMRTLAVA